MGYELQRWAQTFNHPCLTPRTRQVLSAICLVAHDEHGEFWMRATRLINEHLPDLSYGGYRNCVSRLVQNGLLIKIEQGGGRTTGGRGKTTRYRVNSPTVSNPHPDQGMLPEITRSPDASPSAPMRREASQTTTADAAHRRLDELITAGISPEQIIAIMQAVEDTLTPSPTEPDVAETCHDVEKPVTDHDRIPRNLSQSMTGSEGETCHDVEKPVTDHDRIPRNLSQSMTSPQYMRKKIHEEKEEHDAAAWDSDSSDEVTGFFEILATTLADSNYDGIRAAQFADLTPLLTDYETQTGSQPDQRTADYIVSRLRDSKGVRNVVGFLRTVTADVLRTGEGFVTSSPSATATAQDPPAPEVEPDWNLLHLSHVEQVAPAQQAWASALQILRSEVPRPAFENWLSETIGWAYTKETFVVGAPNAFLTEMMAHRLHPLIERAVREVTGEAPMVQYVVQTQKEQTCPVCTPMTAAG